MKKHFVKFLSIFIALLILTVLPLAGCNQTDGEKPKIAVSIIPLSGFAQEIAGDKFDIITLVPAGFSVETFEPTPKQMEEYAKSALTFAIGVPAEDAILKDPQMPVVNLHEKAKEVYDYRYFDEETKKDRDPHIWLSVRRMAVMVAAMGEAIAGLDPENAEFYRTNAAKLEAELEELDGDLQEIFGTVQNKQFVVFHPAYGYLADDYGLTMYALEEEGKEATPQHMQEIIDIAKAAGVKGIFYQAEMDSKQAEAFAEELGGETVMLAPLAPNYIENMRYMAETLARVCDGE